MILDVLYGKKKTLKKVILDVVSTSSITPRSTYPNPTTHALPYNSYIIKNTSIIQKFQPKDMENI